jgi:uncharacterized protein (TIGR01244 family)
MTTTVLRVRSLLLPLFALALCVAPGASQAPAQQAAQTSAPAAVVVPGVRNFTKVDSTIACGGALSPEAFAALKQAGYKSIVNLRAASEPGNDVEAAKKAAEAAGLTYFHLPFVATAPDMTMLDEFLKLVVKPENQPMMLHCASGGRVSMFWAVKRVMIDGWSVDKAMNELPDLAKNANEPTRAAALEYLKAHGKVQP